MPPDPFDEPAYRALRHVASVIDAETVAAEALRRGGDRAGRREAAARLAVLAKLQAVVGREAAKLAGDGGTPPA